MFLLPEPSNTTATGDQQPPPPSNVTSSDQDNQQPGPSRVKKRKTTKFEKVEKSNRQMLQMFMEAQEKSRKEMMELELRRMKWEEEQAKREEAKDNRLMGFLKGMCFMLMAPLMGPPPPPMGLPPPHLPFSLPTTMAGPSPTDPDVNREEEDES